MTTSNRLRHRLERSHGQSLRWGMTEEQWHGQELDKDVVIECGWGRLIFGHTFTDFNRLAQTLCEESPKKRDLVFYVRDPHVVISLAPHEVFLDPSHTYRLWLDRYRPAAKRPKGFVIRLLNSYEDAKKIQEVYQKRQMIPPGEDFVWETRKSKVLTFLIAEEENTEEIIGVLMGVDHVEAFSDPENGSSLWAVAVDPQASYPGIGEALVRQLAEHYLARGRSFLDLSVMHDNHQAIGLYEKLGFKRVPVFTIKRKNSYNEPLFIAPSPEKKLNPYATIIVKEARRRGIGVEVLDAEAGYFALTFGGRSIICRESLTELTTAIAMSRCDDKAVTRRILNSIGLRTPQQLSVGEEQDNLDFLETYSRLVVKPAQGEQGLGISVDVRTPEQLRLAIDNARRFSHHVLLEELVEGQDLRIVVINDEVVAAAIRRPAEIIGTGVDKIVDLIKKQSRRRAAATGGESQIPLDAQTTQCVEDAGFSMETVLPYGEKLQVRKTANLHTGGTIHDVTGHLHPVLQEAAIQAGQALKIPVVGLDFLVPSVKESEYVIIEANERPGLANHEPQPTAEKFIDLLFPQTITR